MPTGMRCCRRWPDLGFEHVELSHGIRITLVPGILKALNEGFIKVSSTHNFCPLPAGMMHAAPNLFEPSAPADQGHEHEQWVRHTRRTLDFAAQVRARAVVMHLGSVRFFWLNPGRQLRNFVRAHPAAALPADERYQRLLAKASDKLRRRHAGVLGADAAQPRGNPALRGGERRAARPREPGEIRGAAARRGFSRVSQVAPAGRAGRLLARHGPRRAEGADGRDHASAGCEENAGG